ncbi:MAG: hypothetical protein VXZ73_04085 [Pseudomonadota bacterium]|nr:hypothetical protein [Pseudomonadota bacterium]
MLFAGVLSSGAKKSQQVVRKSKRWLTHRVQLLRKYWSYTKRFGNTAPPFTRAVNMNPRQGVRIKRQTGEKKKPDLKYVERMSKILSQAELGLGDFLDDEIMCTRFENPMAFWVASKKAIARVCNKETLRSCGGKDPFQRGGEIVKEVEHKPIAILTLLCNLIDQQCKNNTEDKQMVLDYFTNTGNTEDVTVSRSILSLLFAQGVFEKYAMGVIYPKNFALHRLLHCPSKWTTIDKTRLELSKMTDPVILAKGYSSPAKGLMEDCKCPKRLERWLIECEKKTHALIPGMVYERAYLVSKGLSEGQNDFKSCYLWKGIIGGYNKMLEKLKEEPKDIKFLNELLVYSDQEITNEEIRREGWKNS